MKSISNLGDSLGMNLTKANGDTESRREFRGEFNPSFNMVLELFDEKGNLKDTRKIHNTVTTAGKNGLIDQMLASPTLPKAGWMEVGTGTGGTTLLNAYIAGSRVALTSKLRSGNVVTMVGDFAAGVGTGAITEAGIFDVVTANTVNMWCYSSFTVINKAAGDSLKITWTLTAG
jgi:hypothetical protein